MSCFDNYIGLDRSILSRSGLYSYDLPGVELKMLQGLTKDGQADYLEFFAMIGSRAWQNLITDVSLALKDKFFVDAKLVSRETSKFKVTSNITSGLAGIKFQFNLPKYARIHLLSVGLISAQDYASPGVVIQIYDTDENGELLLEVEDDKIEEGRNTINVDKDFEVDKLFVAYDPDLFEFKETENKFYNTSYINWSLLQCIFPCCGDSIAYQGTVTQVNGGGLDVKFVVFCSIEKFICENINLFKTAIWYRYGVELADEQLLGNRLNRFTTMTKERAEERSGYFGAKYSGNVSEAIKSMNISEDPICFNCKNTVMTKTILP